MDAKRPFRVPPGRQLYDPLNGFRVGALAGGLLGALITAATRAPWFLLAGAAIGGAVGYLSERRKLRGDDHDSSQSNASND